MLEAMSHIAALSSSPHADWTTLHGNIKTFQIKYIEVKCIGVHIKYTAKREKNNIFSVRNFGIGLIGMVEIEKT